MPATTNPDLRVYHCAQCVVFMETNKAFGGLSNMAANFPLNVNGVSIRTSEALYQACRFPLQPEIQEGIIAKVSPMAAKMFSKRYRREFTRPDWERRKIEIMRWCLRVKLAQNWEKFGRLLLATEDRPIVERSRKDAFWGAKPVDDETLEGTNALGRLLMELRQLLKEPDADSLKVVPSLNIPQFLLYGEPIDEVSAPSFSLLSSSLR